MISMNSSGWLMAGSKTLDKRWDSTRWMLCGLPCCPRCRTQVDEDQLRILINFDILFWSSWKFIIHIKTIISLWSCQAQYVLYLTTRSRYQETLALALSFISSFHANDFHQLCNWEFWSRAWHINCVWMQKSAEMRGAVDSGIIPLCVINILIAFVFVGKCEKMIAFLICFLPTLLISAGIKLLSR